jgi:hypothetical protein
MQGSIGGFLMTDEPLFLMLNPFQTGIPTAFIMIFDT